MSKTLPNLIANVNTWRDQLNPLRSLTISRAVALLENSQRGQLADLQWTYEFIEMTDSDLVAIVERTVSALVEMDWNIKTVPSDAIGFDEKLATDQAMALRLAYERIDNYAEAIEHYALASIRGFSICQPHRDPAGNIVHLEPLNHWNFARDGRAGQWAWNPEARDVPASSLPAGSMLDPSEILVLESRRPIDRLGLIKFVRASMSEKDWDAYVEIYGIPGWIIIGPPNVPQDKQAEYQTAAEEIAEGGSGYLPNGSDAKSAANPAGQSPFNPRLQWLTEKLVLAATGGLLTMLSASGTGTLAGSVHLEAFRMIARMRAAKISELFQRRLDREVLDREFPGKPRLAYFSIDAKETQNKADTIKEIVDLSAAYDLDPEEVSEKTGYTIVGRKAPTPGLPPAPASTLLGKETQHSSLSTQNFLAASASGDRRATVEALGDQVDAKLQAAARDALAQAMAKDLAPVRARIEAALALTDDQAMLTALGKIPGELPALLQAICKDPAAQPILEESMAAALLNGIAEGAALHAKAETTNLDSSLSTQHSSLITSSDSWSARLRSLGYSAQAADRIAAKLERANT